MNMLTAVEQLAAARRLSAEEFMAQAELAIEESSYPSPECLLPAEVAHFREHDSWPAECAEEIELHLGWCLACRTLLEASSPGTDRKREFVHYAAQGGGR